jgi:hypothetical protein
MPKQPISARVEEKILKKKTMNEAEKLLEKFARKNMIEWNQESFKRTHSRLHKSIIEALNEALRIHFVVGQSEQLVCDQVCDWYSVGHQLNGRQECRTCGKQKAF